MNKLQKTITVSVLAIFLGILSGSYYNNSLASSGCDNFGCGYEPITGQFRCWGIDGAEDCSDGNGECSDQNCSGGGSGGGDPIEIQFQ